MIPLTKLNIDVLASAGFQRDRNQILLWFMYELFNPNYITSFHLFETTAKFRLKLSLNRVSLLARLVLCAAYLLSKWFNFFKTLLDHKLNTNIIICFWSNFNFVILGLKTSPHFLKTEFRDWDPSQSFSIVLHS